MPSIEKTPTLSANFAGALERNIRYTVSDCTYSEELAASRSLATDAAGREAFRAFRTIADTTHPGRALFFLADNVVHLESETPGNSWCSLKFLPGEVEKFTFPAAVSISSLARMSTYRGGRVCDECLGHAMRYAEAFLAASAESLLLDLDVAALQGLVNP